MNLILKTAIFNAVATALYVTFLVNAIFYGPKFFNLPEPETVLVPIMMLSIFVFSAAVTGGLVLGKPILWYLDGKKREAVTLFIQTLVVLFFIILSIGGLVLLTN